MRTFDLPCLSNAEIKQCKSSIIKKAIGIIALCTLSAIINQHFGNTMLTALSFGLAFVISINAFYDYLFYLPVKSALGERELLTMIEEHPELALYHKKVLAQKRAFITREAEMMRQWCQERKQEKVAQTLYPK